MAVGVIMHATTRGSPGFFGNGVDLQERTVMQFEPLTNDRCKPGTANPHP